jgi:hypothetical protein
MGKGGHGDRLANDKRSDSMNRNNPAFHASEENRRDQLNPDHRAYRKSHHVKSDDEEE